MIEIGKHYRLETLELTDEGYGKSYITVEVTGRDGNLLQVNGCEIINMASPLFHALIDVEGQAAFHKKLHDDLTARMNEEDFT